MYFFLEVCIAFQFTRLYPWLLSCFISPCQMSMLSYPHRMIYVSCFLSSMFHCSPTLNILIISLLTFLLSHFCPLRSFLSEWCLWDWVWGFFWENTLFLPLEFLVCLSSSSFCLSFLLFASHFYFYSSNFVIPLIFFPILAMSCLFFCQDVASYIQNTPLSYVCHLPLLLSTLLFLWTC